jgi:hypothetical protein
LGFMDWVPGIRATNQAPDGGSRPWRLATVKQGEASRTKFSGNHDAMELVKRATGLPAILARINATACANQKLRLYRKSSRRSGGKAVPAARRRYLGSGDAGHKAADWFESAGDVVEVSNHPILDAITRPNVYQNGAQYDWCQFWNMEITGDAFELVAPGGIILPLAPQHTQPIVSVDGFVDGFAYGRNRSHIQTFDADVVVQYKLGQHPDDPFSGYGSLRDVLHEADVLQVNTLFDVELGERGNLPGVWVIVEGQGTGTDDDEKLNNLQMRYESKVHGYGSQLGSFWARNIRPIFSPSNNRELQHIEKLGEHRRQVLASFGVPESMYALNSSNLASATAGYEVQYLDATVRPRINGYAQARTEMLLPLLGYEAGEYMLAYDNPVPEDEERLLRVASDGYAKGVLKLDEARNLMGYEPVEGGDQFYSAPAPSPFTLSVPEPERVVEPKALPGRFVVVPARRGGFYAQGDCHCSSRTKDDDREPSFFQFGTISEVEGEMRAELLAMFRAVARAWQGWPHNRGGSTCRRWTPI